ncbi:MAG: hypothetical protein KY475_00315 [Planctomycetes bacterium]|nr:hypothetical protein [Planctomycetota bacterium]
MGVPEHPHQRSTSGGVFVVLAVLLIGGALAGLALAMLGFGFFAVRRAPIAVAATEAEVQRIDQLMVEIDQQGQTYLDGAPVPLEEIESRFQQQLDDGFAAHDAAQIRFEEGCPFEHVEKVREMFARLGLEDPEMNAVPPRRHVEVSLDAEGNVHIDEQPTDDVQGALQKIAQRHGRRATVQLTVHPQCPADAVAQVVEMCEQLGLGDVIVESAEDAAQPAQ